MTETIQLSDAVRETLKGYVLAGAKLMDEVRPGWTDEVNRVDLHMASCSRCVLGQVFGGFAVGCGDLELTWRAAVAHGFALSSFEVGGGTLADDPLMVAAYDYLRDLWVEQIDSRVG